MSRTDSKIDLDTYKPTLADARRIADEDAAQARLKKARDNPAPDTGPAEAQEEPPPPSPRVTKPSPWANGATPGAEPVDRAALPSASAPKASAERTPARKDEPARRPWPLWLKVLCALALLSSPALAIYVVFVRPAVAGRETGVPPSGVTPPTLGSSAAAPPPTASSSPGAAPTGSVLPAIAPPAPVTTGAAPTATSAAVPAPERPHAPTKRPSGSEDPYADAAVPLHPHPTPPAPATAIPETPATAAARAPDPAPQPSASASSPFQYFRKKD